MRALRKAGLVAAAVPALAGLVLIADAPGDSARSVRAYLKTPDGATVGRVDFRQASGPVQVGFRVAGLEPGFHGFHVHQTGACEAPSFTSAGAPA